MSQGFATERAGDVLVVRIDRPAVRNAVDGATSHAIDAVLTAAEADPDIGAMVVTGTGERSFCSGMDLKEAAERGIGLGLVEGRGFCGITERTFAKPIIAAVNGAAVAGGFEIALACDLIVASETAIFGIPEVKRGLVPWTGGVQRLARQLPRATGLALILTGDPVPARRLYDLGVVTKVVPQAEVLAEALALARTMLANSWMALRFGKRLYDAAVNLPLEESLALGRSLGVEIRAAGDSMEGVRAYAEHRGARFTDR